MMPFGCGEASMLGVVLAVGLLAQTANPLAAAIQAQRATPVTEPARRPPSMNFSPTAAVTYAVQHGCVPAAATGLPARRFFEPSVFSRGPAEGPGVHMVTSVVTLEQDRLGFCTVSSTRGDPEELRAAVLAALSEMGVAQMVKSDSGPGSRDSSGSFRQELICLTIDAKPAFLVMSTSSERNRKRLMASFGLDTDGGCAGR
jgi:hypothetical protein